MPQIGGLGLVLPKLRTQKEVGMKTVWKAQGTKLVSDLHWYREISPPNLYVLYLCLGWLIFFMGLGLVKIRFANLLNWYLLSWNGTQFPSLCRHTQIEDEWGVRGSNWNVTLQITVLHRVAL
jgi:hypothetical protein